MAKRATLATSNTVSATNDTVPGAANSVQSATSDAEFTHAAAEGDFGPLAFFTLPATPGGRAGFHLKFRDPNPKPCRIPKMLKCKKKTRRSLIYADK